MRVLVFILALFFAWGVPLASCAQLAPAQIEIRVNDGNGVPLENARVFISGPAMTSALTPRDGRLRFDDVEPGIYDLRVERTGYDAVRVGEVEALAGRRRTVEVTLTKSAPKAAASSAPAAGGGLAEIGRVTARPSVVVSSTDVDDGSPLRRVSESLVDALGKMAGVSVDTTNATGTLTISLRNADPSQTLATAGGSPLLGGAAPQLQQVAGDLASGAGIDTNPRFGSNGGVGGSVNFRTLEPTKTWQSTLSAAYGTYERSYATFSLSGSQKKLGIAVQHGVRGGDDVLTGLTFADTSGATYRHDGANARDSDFVKLRYSVSPKLTFNASYIAGSYHSSPICHDFITTEPCGYGPGNLSYGNSHNRDFRVQAQIGSVSFFAGTFENAYRSTTDEAHLTVAGIPEPIFSFSRGSGIGFYTYATVPKDRQTLAIALGAFNGVNTTVASGAFQYPTSSPYRFGWFSVQDTFKMSERWETAVNSGTSTSIAGTVASGGINLTMHPSKLETISLGVNAGGANGGYNYGNAPFGDPARGTYNCSADEVRVTGPNEPDVASSSRSVEFTYDRRGRRGTLRISAYDRLERGSTLQAQFPLLALTTPLPSGYLAAIEKIWSQPTICGAAPFDPARVYVAESIAGTTTRYRGVDAQGQIVLGRETIVQPSYSIGGATLAASDPRLLSSGSPYQLGGQLPFKPLHRAGLTLDVRQPRANLEWLLNGQWTSANNSSALGSYVVANAGVSWAAHRGRFTIVASNLFNADTGLFSTTEFAQPLSLVGGGTYVPVPKLLTPRSYTLIYTVRGGRLK
ncbi:MAG: TonB-dependent outer rane receptor [Candidatus Eremiobacteraeota bacterium]|nr:TonB-dependent outer rane receptor [Candidatus Eremiobacteraeota bacterium]